MSRLVEDIHKRIRGRRAELARLAATEVLTGAQPTAKDAVREVMVTHAPDWDLDGVNEQLVLVRVERALAVLEGNLQ